MGSKVTARRYALALQGAASKHGLTAAVADDLAALEVALTNSPEFAHIFQHRQLPAASKKKMLEPVLSELITEKFTRNLLDLLWQKKRETELLSIIASYQAALSHARREVVAEVTSTRQLGAAELRQLEAKVKAVTKCQTVQMQTKIDQSLLGGLVLRIGDTVYDGSLARRLQQLRQVLSQAQVKQSGVSS